MSYARIDPTYSMWQYVVVAASPYIFFVAMAMWSAEQVRRRLG